MIPVVIQPIVIGNSDPVSAVDLYGDGLMRFAVDTITAATLPASAGTYMLSVTTASHIVSSISAAGMQTAATILTTNNSIELQAADAEQSIGTQVAKVYEGRTLSSKLKGKALKNRLAMTMAALQKPVTAVAVAPMPKPVVNPQSLPKLPSSTPAVRSTR